MRIYLVRHFESVKNRRMTLSSLEDCEGLTERGALRGAQVGTFLLDHFRSEDLKVKTVYASSSARGRQSGELLAAVFGCGSVKSCDFLRSTKAGPFAGLSARVIRRLNAEWYQSF